MLEPTNRTITIPVGGTALVGRTTAVPGGDGGSVPSGMPAWLNGSTLNQWIELPLATAFPNQGGDPGSLRNDLYNTYSGMAVTPDGRLIAGALGGHADGDNNAVRMLDLRENDPAIKGWELLKAGASPNYYQPYSRDVPPSPTSRHVYDHVVWSAVLGRVIWPGSQNNSPNSPSFPTMDGFDPVAKQWDAPGTYPYTTLPTGPQYPGPTANGYYPQMDYAFTVGDGTGIAELNGANIPGYTSEFFYGNNVDEFGNIWSSAKAKFDIITRQWSKPTNWSSLSNPPPGPWALDTNRNLSFGMAVGSGAGSDLFLGLRAAKRVGNVVSFVTINPSAARDLFVAQEPIYAGMTFDPVNDEFLILGVGNYGGNTALFSVKPNSSNAWDITVKTFAGSIPEIGRSGLHNRMQYIPALKGIVLAPCQNRGTFFVRTS